VNVLCIGDVVGSGGVNFLKENLSMLKKLNKIDVVIVNGENSANGNGITPSAAEELLNMSADVITTGNHAFRRREVYETFDTCEFLIRPANYPKSAPGKGVCILDFGMTQLAVINLLGTVYMENMRCPFEIMDELLTDISTKNIIVDFHAEATAEKRALAEYLDGRVSALFGTHTHVQTADEQILKQGTGFITDIGMTGPADSVLGVKSSLAIEKMKTKMPVRFDFADGVHQLNGLLIEIDSKTGKSTHLNRINLQK